MMLLMIAGYLPDKQMQKRTIGADERVREVNVVSPDFPWSLLHE